MADYESDFSIRRYLSDESIGEIHHATENLTSTNLVQRKDKSLGLTIVSRGLVAHHLRQRNIIETQARYDKVFKRPIIPSSLESMNLRVSDVRYFGRSLGRLSLALVLDDPEGILEAEHDTYIKRIHSEKRIGVGSFIPHISIGSVPYEHATTSLLTSLESDIPETIDLRPVSTKHPHFLPYSMKVANGLITPNETVPQIERTHTPTVHELLPLLSHPIQFISSLRKSHLTEVEPATIESNV